MRLIKRYPNRKLYDTDQRSYITLEGVAELIRDGETVQVIDYSSGEDLTSQTLSQIILEKEKNQAGFLPQNVLASLVQAGGKTVGGLQRALASSLGWWSQFDEEIKGRLDALVETGDLTEPEAEGLLKKIANVGESIRTTTARHSQQTIEDFLRQRGVPTKQEITQISAQLDALEAKIASLDSVERADSEDRTSAHQEQSGSSSNKKAVKKSKPAPGEDHASSGAMDD